MQKLITYIEAVDPTPSNNVAAGFAVGHFWRNSVSGKLFYHKLDGVWESYAEVTIVENTVASTWVADTTYPYFIYKSEITISGLLATDIVDVVFAHEQATSNNYSPICLVGANLLTIYSKVNTTITIPLITITR